MCLGNFYIDNYSYQENLLTKYHKKLGHEVKIIASLFNFNDKGKPYYIDKCNDYINENGIEVSRLAYKKPSFIYKKLRRYYGTYEKINGYNPDIVFIHGCQFLDIDKVVKYLKKYPDTKVFIDNHADFSNSAKNWISLNILHKIIWKSCLTKIKPYVKKFYGVLPARVDFLIKIYKSPPEKTELLVMGADDDYVKTSKDIADIRQKHNIKDDDFLIVTGGKLDIYKNIDLLLKAIDKINNDKIKLIIFGEGDNNTNPIFANYLKHKNIVFIGWISSDSVYKYFNNANLVVFPGRHSVLWEQAVACGVPCVFKWWEGTTHLDLGNNCLFLHEDTPEAIINIINLIYNDTELFAEMKNKALKVADNFLYSKIAKESIGE